MCHLLVFWCGGVHFAAAPPSATDEVNVLAAQMLQVHKHRESVNQQMRQLTDGINGRIAALNEAREHLNQPHDADQVNRNREMLNLYKERIPRVEKRIADLEATCMQLRNGSDDRQFRRCQVRLKQYAEEVTFLENRITALQILVETGSITDPERRAVKTLELAQESQALRAKCKHLEGPFRRQLREIAEATADVHRKYGLAVARYFTDPGDRYPEVREKRAQSNPSGYVTCTWFDLNGEAVAYVSTFVRDKPIPPDNAEWLDEKFLLAGISKTHISLWAGQFKVQFDVYKPEWQDRERVKQMVTRFVDLQGLWRIDASGDLETSPKKQ